MKICTHIRGQSSPVNYRTFGFSWEYVILKEERPELKEFALFYTCAMQDCLVF